VRRGRRGLGFLAAVALGAAGCSTGPVPVGGDVVGQERAQAVLQRWADAVAKAGPNAFPVVGELTAQVGDWETEVGGNNKSALMSGVIDTATALDAAAPPAGTIRWPDGATQTAELISAVEALAAIRGESVQPCPECAPLHVTAARLTTGPVETARGTATAPIWELTIAGTKVLVTRVAVRSTVRVVPGPDTRVSGVYVMKAAVAADGRTLTVSFIGAPGDASRACGEDYTGQAFESDLAVVVIVQVHRNPMPASCTAVGAERAAVVTLATPLGNRAVLEIGQGLPVPVARS